MEPIQAWGNMEYEPGARCDKLILAASNMMRFIDPYAVALSMLIGSVGFGMTYFFNTNFSTWGMQEIGYPAMAMMYVYFRNGRFRPEEADGEPGCSRTEENGNRNCGRNRASCAASPSDTAAQESLAGGNKIRVPLPADGISGAHLVTGAPLTDAGEGALIVVFFWATWCGSSQKCLPALLSTAGRYREEGVRFAGVSQESEDDLLYFSESYKRPLRSTAFVADGEGKLTENYQGAHGLSTIPHCYIVRSVEGDSSGVDGVVEWHGHPTRLETALAYLLEEEEQEAEDDEAS